jgi:diguanylate cyclase (GGDEF)-like protein
VIRHSSRELEALIAIATSVAGAHRLEDVLEVAATRAREAVGATTMSISRWDVEHGRLRTLINAGEEDLWPEAEYYPLDDFPAAVALLAAGRPHVTAVDDPAADPAERRLLREIEKESAAAVPIVYQGVTWGELYAATAPGEPRLTERDVRYMQAICGQIGLALGRAELFSRLSALAFEDGLTGLSNRRAVEERLDELATHREPVALLLGDLDGLKAVNDRSGHDAGDAVLRATADALHCAVGPDAATSVARLGGDEFCVLMPGSTAAQAEAFAQRVDEHLSLSVAGVTFSWGLALVPARAWKPAELLRAADVAQYDAKSSGGACLRTAAPATLSGGPPPRPPARARDSAPLAGGLVLTALAWLDGLGQHAPAPRRMQRVAELGAEALDAAAWAVSAGGGDTLMTVARAERRGEPVAGGGDASPLEGHAAATAVLRRGGAFHADRTDPAERALLDGCGAAQVLAAGAAGHLVELYGDERTLPMGWAAPTLRLLMREAAHVV